MKYAALLMIAAAAAGFLSDYVRALRADARAYLLLGRFMRSIEHGIGKLSLAPTGIAAMLSDSSDAELRELSELILRPSEADKLGIKDCNDKKRLCEYISGIGKRSRERETAEARELAEYIEKASKQQGSACEKRVRSAGLIYGASVISALIVLA